jgi:hypothetical protein
MIIHIHGIGLELCKRMDRETTKYWSAINLMWQFTHSYTLVERGGIQGTDRAISTCRLPLDRRKGMQSHTPIYLGTSPVYIVTTQVPRGPRPYGSICKELGCTRRHDEPPPVLSSNPQQTYGMNV